LLANRPSGTRQNLSAKWFTVFATQKLLPTAASLQLVV